METPPKIYSCCVKCSAAKSGGSECPECGAIYAKAEAAEESRLKAHKKPDVEVEKEKAVSESQVTQNDKLIKCPACDRDVSKNAESCPHCAEPLLKKTVPPKVEKKDSLKVGCLGFIFLFGIYAFFSNPSSDTSSQPATDSPKTAKELRRVQLEKCLSGWDGSHIGLTPKIKKAMNDPDSYQHDETKYWDANDHLVVITSFRGKNAFGGIVRQWVKAKTDISTCNVIEIIEEGK
jgi:hypothetical protein